MTFEELKNNHSVNVYISAADESLKSLGFTEHSFPHVTKVATLAAEILTTLGYSSKDVELAKISGYLHDIGNIANRIEHSQSGAVMAFRILDNLNMEPEDIATVVSAIGNHDEGTGVPVNAVAAALILADKSDVRRSRVRKFDVNSLDIHDRVNYSVVDAKLKVDAQSKIITLELKIDTAYSSVMEFFEIFLERMRLCRKAAKKLDTAFKLVINSQELM